MPLGPPTSARTQASSPGGVRVELEVGWLVGVGGGVEWVELEWGWGLVGWWSGVGGVGVGMGVGWLVGWWSGVGGVGVGMGVGWLVEWSGWSWSGDGGWLGGLGWLVGVGLVDWAGWGMGKLWEESGKAVRTSESKIKRNKVVPTRNQYQSHP